MGKKEKRERKEREEWMLRNGGLLLEKRISYFDCKYSNPIRSFSAEELQKATDNYSHLNRIFEGGEFRWYKGCLDGRVVCLKKCNSNIFLSSLEMSTNEISVAAQVSGHKNALKLLGCCLETPIPTLVFEFPRNGNLFDQLRSDPTCLQWKIRLKIANEIASVITYLHTKFPRPIIRRDIHLRHVYLDEDLCAKVSDFMYCMALPEGETLIKNEPLMGTFGYMAPELMLHRVSSEKTDVYGFGSLLLDLLMGNRYGDKASIKYYGTSNIRNHTMNEIVDPIIMDEAEAEAETRGGVHHLHHQFQAVLELILRCHRKNAEERPIMLDVAKQLKRIQRGDFISDKSNHNDTSSSYNIGCPKCLAGGESIEMWNKKKREEECMLRNGELLLEKRISYFDCIYSNPFRGFSAKELQKATDNYSHLNGIFIQQERFNWYKGCLEGGKVIFVKKYFGYPSADLEKVSNEISVAAQVSDHKNALKLLGCCLETRIPTPVFEFPRNGNLREQLRSNPTCLPWKIRLKIAHEIASVITHLHTKFPRPIIHRDLRPDLFYLDQDLCAKLSDFMLCMALPEGETLIENEPVMGTLGYVAPELLDYGVYSEKTDVFAFGSLLLDLLTGNRFGVMESLDYIRNHTMNEIVDPTILAEAEAEAEAAAATGGGGGGGVHHLHHEFQAVLELILKCHRMNAEERPIMLDAAKQLKRIQRGDFISNKSNYNDTSSSYNIGCLKW